MREFSFVNRFLFVLFDLVLILVTVTSFYFGVERICIYFSYPDVIVLSVLSVLSALFFIISTPILLLSLHPICKGVRSKIEFQKNMGKFMLISFVSIIMLSLGFNIYYVSALSDKGYIKCQSIPSGWMPGMATKYVTNKALCSKKGSL